MQSSSIDFIAETIQITKSHNLLNIPDRIDVEYEDRLIDESGNIAIASVDVIDGVIYVDRRIDELPKHDQINVITHELVHIDQYRSGWLDYADDNKTKWFGYPFNRHTTHEEYMNQPWERDAYRRGPEVARQVKRIMNSGITTGNC